jgi:hypothetical protein
MLYTIIESFSPTNGDKWTSYCAWRGIHFERFHSIDGILRPNLFTQLIDEDWAHIVNADYMLHFITDWDYAIKKQSEIGRGELVGVAFDQHDENAVDFLGFDLIDSYFDVSLLTNWRNDVDIINCSISANGLVCSSSSIKNIQHELLRSFGSDPHIEGCKIVSIYKPNNIK